MDKLAKGIRRGTITGTLGKQNLLPDKKVIVKNSFNSLSDDPEQIKQLIEQTVKDSQVNSAMTNA